MTSDNKIKTGILLLNLGGPDSLRSVRPFLFNLFSDRDIIRLGPRFMQKPLAWLISSLRAAKTESLYKLIGGKSPIYDMTLAQAKALENELNSAQFTIHDSQFTVYIAMRYWHPLIEDVISEIYNAGIKRLIVLNLYPQYSVATTGSSLSKLDKVISKYPMEIFSIKSWYAHPLYIDALVEKIRKGMELYGRTASSPSPQSSLSRGEEGLISTPPLRGGDEGEGDIHVLFSAHSLPVKFIEEGDPYAEQINWTIREVVKKIDIQWSLSYQSKSGPVKWLEPSTEKKLEELAVRGIKNLLVVPISFVSDHIETLYEIDILYKNMAKTLGVRLERTESLNISPLFISALCDIVITGMKETGWQE
ncbi:MAG: hypothetical protein A2X59_06425 [Nitrospirae bacterium GWC2_42_7]|nr:MAG: hypothetical protein A2X59_06425 [Nitrospirae bacterium GWC2_42_7]